MKTFSHEVVLQASASAVNVADWTFTMTEEDYRACARGHEAMGTVGGERRLGLVNVETIAGTLIVQHYRTQTALRDHVSFLSAASTGFLLHLVPFAMAVSLGDASHTSLGGHVHLPLHDRLRGADLGQDRRRAKRQ